MVTTDEARALARYARECVRAALGGPAAEAPPGDVFEAPGAAFVSLHRACGTLQGCIGSIQPYRGLADDVARNAEAAALRDPRAVPLEVGDVDALEVEVTVLGPLELVDATTEAEVCVTLCPGRDGVVLAWNGRRATFIPQMWRHFAAPEELLAELKLKAGLPADFWGPDVLVWRYGAVVGVDPRA
jgi:AmmeMemoRadiSam system protein A